MFNSFFPRPKLFFLSFAMWSIACVVAWFTVGRDLGTAFSLGGWFGHEFPTGPLELREFSPMEEPAADADRSAYASVQARQMAARAAHEAARESAGTFWFYQYLVLAYALFLAFWYRFSPHRWARWSVFGSAAIIFVTWFQVQLDVMINNWFGTFYDLIQQALAEPHSVSTGEYFGQLLTFGKIALVAITVAVFTRFFVSHYIFRWRTAMNDHYMSLWERVRHIEGASQRVQEDTMRFTQNYVKGAEAPSRIATASL